MTAFALAVASAIAGVASSLLFAVRARSEARNAEDAAISANIAWRECGRLRRLLRDSDAALADATERLRQADAALRLADREIALRDAEGRAATP